MTKVASTASQALERGRGRPGSLLQCCRGAIRLEQSQRFDYDDKELILLLRFNMPDAAANPASLAHPPHLAELQAMLEREIPMCAQMGISVHHGSADGLVMRLPLDRNRNHQQTAFAGSLNALCTIAGWGSVFLLLKELNRRGSIVIRRSSIRYQEPVSTSEIYARCLPITAEARQYFLEMLDDKGQAKLELAVEVTGADGPAVSFSGSYVVLPQ